MLKSKVWLYQNQCRWSRKAMRNLGKSLLMSARFHWLGASLPRMPSSKWVPTNLIFISTNKLLVLQSAVPFWYHDSATCQSGMLPGREKHDQADYRIRSGKRCMAGGPELFCYFFNLDFFLLAANIDAM